MLLYFVFSSIFKGKADICIGVNRNAVNQGVPQFFSEFCNNTFLLLELTHKYAYACESDNTKGA